MAKTNPIGVRFRTDVLESLKTDFKIESPQQALVFLERMYVTFKDKINWTLTALRDEEINSEEKQPEGLSGIALKIWQEEQKLKTPKNGK